MKEPEEENPTQQVLDIAVRIAYCAMGIAVSVALALLLGGCEVR